MVGADTVDDVDAVSVDVVAAAADVVAAELSVVAVAVEGVDDGVVTGGGVPFSSFSWLVI